MTQESTMPLMLTVTAESAACSRMAPIPVTVALQNVSQFPLLINARMGVGYEDGVVRELFFTVFAGDGRVLPVPDEVRTDAHRMPPRKEDFLELAPGRVVTAVVDINLWYRFPAPGMYRVVFTYENTWDLSEGGVAAWTGRVDASPLSLLID